MNKEIRSSKWVKSQDDLNEEESELLQKTKQDFYEKGYNTFEQCVGSMYKNERWRELFSVDMDLINAHDKRMY